MKFAIVHKDTAVRDNPALTSAEDHNSNNNNQSRSQRTKAWIRRRLGIGVKCDSEKAAKPKTVPALELFRYATGTEKIMIVMGKVVWSRE